MTFRHFEYAQKVYLCVSVTQHLLALNATRYHGIGLPSKYQTQMEIWYVLILSQNDCEIFHVIIYHLLWMQLLYPYKIKLSASEHFQCFQFPLPLWKYSEFTEITEDWYCILIQNAFVSNKILQVLSILFNLLHTFSLIWYVFAFRSRQFHRQLTYFLRKTQ